MAASTFSDDALAQRLALEVCGQWQLENGRTTLSVSDLAEIKKWTCTSHATISSFPSLRALAVKGINNLIARQLRGEEVTPVRTGCGGDRRP